MEPLETPSGPLDNRQIQRFAQDGYVVVPGMYDVDEMREIAAITREVEDGRSRTGQKPPAAT